MDINYLHDTPENVSILIKKYFLEKAAENNSQLKDVNFDGSNISTLISALTYVFTTLSIKTDLMINEVTPNAKIESSIMSLIKKYGYEPRRMISSRITLELRLSDTNLDASVTSKTLDKGDVIIVKADDTEFYHILENDTVFDETYSKYEFKQGKLVEKTYFISTNDNEIIIDTHKWNIDNDSLVVTHNPTDSEIEFLANNKTIEDTSDILVDGMFYYLDYTEDDKLLIKLSNDELGKNVYGSVSVSFYETLGNEGNNISESNLIIENTDADIYSTELIHVSAGGAGAEGFEVIKELMGRFYQTQDRIVTKSDLNTFIEYLFPNWQYNVLDSNDLPIANANAGMVYVSLYKVSDSGVVERMNYDNYVNEIDIINKKARFGINIVFNDIQYNNLLIKYSSYLNKNVVGNYPTPLKNNINNILLSNINNNNISYINKSILQMYIVQENINGMVDFKIDSVGFGLTIDSDYDDTKSFVNYIGSDALNLLDNYDVNITYNGITTTINNSNLEVTTFGSSFYIRNTVIIDGLIPQYTNLITFTEVVGSTYGKTTYHINFNDISVVTRDSFNISIDVTDSNPTFQGFEPKPILNVNNIDSNITLIEI